MGTIRQSTGSAKPIVHSARVCGLAIALAMCSALAVAQDAPQQPAAPKPQDGGGFIAAATRWLSEQAQSLNSGFKDARSKVENFSREAGIAAKTTADGAKDAADAVARIPNARVVTGHEKCHLAANGAPDCVAAANDVCKARGFSSGKSVDMTTAEICPPKVYMQGNSNAQSCVTETFVSSALCQ